MHYSIYICIYCSLNLYNYTIFSKGLSFKYLKDSSTKEGMCHRFFLGGVGWGGGGGSPYFFFFFNYERNDKCYNFFYIVLIIENTDFKLVFL